MTVRTTNLGTFTFVDTSLSEAVAHSTSTGGVSGSSGTGTVYPIGYYNSTSNYNQTWEHPIDLGVIGRYLPSIDVADQKKLINVFETNARSLEDHLDVAYLKTSGGTVYGPTVMSGDVNLIGTVRVEDIPLESLLPPAGSVTMYAGLNVPPGWIECLGQAVSRTSYSALFASLGTAYGAGDGSTTFNLPNMQSRMPFGQVNGSGTVVRGATGGSETVTLTSAQSGLVGHNHDQLSHNHTQNPHSHTQPSHDHTFTTTPNGDHSHTLPTAKQGAASSAHNGVSTFAAGMTVSTGDIFLSSSTQPTHSHTGTTSAGGDNAIDAATAVNQAVTASNVAIAAANATQAHDNMPPYLVFKFIIKT